MTAAIELKKILYIGIDVHKRTWRIHIKTDLFSHKQYSGLPCALTLFNYVEKHFKNYEVHVVYEACCTGFSAARAFLNYGWHAMVVNTADIPTSSKHRYQKTDSIDSRHLCERLRQGDLHGIHIPLEQEDYMKSLIRHRNKIVKQFRKIKSQIKSYLLYHSIEIPEALDNPNWTISFLQWLNDLKWEFESADFSMQSNLRLYRAVHKEYLEAGNAIRKYCRVHYKKDYDLLLSIPGIGGIVAGAILGELGDIRRFTNESQFSNYIGLVPGVNQSGESQVKGMGITPRAKSLLRSYLIESSWIAVRKDPEMQAYYRKHTGKLPNVIIVKVAHKLCRRILGIIKSGKPYEVNKNLVVE